MPSQCYALDVYGVVNPCESIEMTFEMITFAVNPFTRHLMTTLAICIFYNAIYS